MRVRRRSSRVLRLLELKLMSPFFFKGLTYCWHLGSNRSKGGWFLLSSSECASKAKHEKEKTSP